MQVVPPKAELQTNTQNRKDLPLEESKTILKPLNSNENGMLNPASIVSNKEMIIRKKKQYKTFLKMIKQGRFTNAMISARILKIERNTITEWMKTKKVVEAMNEDINNYVSDIQKSKDWKAKAYLIDKLEGIDNKTNDTQDIKQLIVINT